MVVVDKLSKSTHFIPVKTPYIAANIADIFMKEIFHLHGIPKVIITDRDPKFTGSFWKTLFEWLNTKLNSSIACHPQMDGQIERVNQVLEDMLQMYVRNYSKKCEDFFTEMNLLIITIIKLQQSLVLLKYYMVESVTVLLHGVIQ